MMIAAAHAIADSVKPDELNAAYIVPSVFDASIAPAVAAAVKHVASPDPEGAEPGAAPVGARP
jgi:malate dehydrogenase (oxaloacetate-decarboxylating)